MAERTLSPEQLLALPHDRTLAYATSGDPTSTNVVLFFHGVFGVGTAADPLSPALLERGVHFVAPTLPSWGNTSPIPHGVGFHDQLYQDVTALINHLHPNVDGLKLYISGGSFGTVPAQMLYGAPYERFPLGRHIAGLLLLAPFSPFSVHKDYSKCLSLANYLFLGPGSQYIPFKLVPRLGVAMLKGKVDTREHAEQFMRDHFLSKMTPEERELCEQWKVKWGIKDGEEGKEMADGMYRSVRNGWDGFMAVPGVLRSDWGGYSPSKLDDEHSKPVLLFLTHGDPEMKAMGEWLGGQLKNAHIRYGAGGHIGALFVLDDIWADFMSRC